MGAPIYLSLPLFSVATQRTMAGTSGESDDGVAVVIFWGQVPNLDWSSSISLLLSAAKSGVSLRRLRCLSGHRRSHSDTHDRVALGSAVGIPH